MDTINVPPFDKDLPPVELEPKHKRARRLLGREREVAAAKVQALKELKVRNKDIADYFGVEEEVVYQLSKVKTTDVEFFKEIAAKQFLKEDWELANLAYDKMKEKLEKGDSKLWEITGAYKVTRELMKDRQAATGGNLVVNISTDGGISFNAPKKYNAIEGETVDR